MHVQLTNIFSCLPALSVEQKGFSGPELVGNPLLFQLEHGVLLLALSFVSIITSRALCPSVDIAWHVYPKMHHKHDDVNILITSVDAYNGCCPGTARAPKIHIGCLGAEDRRRQQGTPVPPCCGPCTSHAIDLLAILKVVAMNELRKKMITLSFQGFR